MVDVCPGFNSIPTLSLTEGLSLSGRIPMRHPDWFPLIARLLTTTPTISIGLNRSCYFFPLIVDGEVSPLPDRAIGSLNR